MSIVEINHEIQMLEHKIWLINISSDILQPHEKLQIEQYERRIRELKEVRYAITD